MDKETLSNYGWIVICVLVLATLIALASPFGNFVAGAIKSTTAGLWDVNSTALNKAGIDTGENVFTDNTTSKECQHEYNEYNVCKHCPTLQPEKTFGIYEIKPGLEGTLEVVYKLLLTPEAATDSKARVYFTISDSAGTISKSVYIKDAKFDGIFYYVACPLDAKRLSSDINFKFITSTETSNIYTHSFKSISEEILSAPEKNKEIIPLIKAMLNYGACAQINLNYNTSNLANDIQHMTDEDKQVPSIDFAQYKHTYSGTQSGVSFYALQTTLNDDIDIKVYFNFTNPSDVNSMNVVVNGTEITSKTPASLYIVKVPNIRIQDCDKVNVVQVGNYTINLSVFTYGYFAQYYNGYPDSTRALMNAMYVYYQEQIKYDA